MVEVEVTIFLELMMWWKYYSINVLSILELWFGHNLVKEYETLQGQELG